MSCSVYIATPMTGRSRQEQISRALYLCSVLTQYGLKGISPVIEEGVENKPGVLLQNSEERLKGFWNRDKDIMSYRARVTLIDGGDEGSVGVGREHGFNRYCLWKPTVVIWKKDRGITVAKFEDDALFVNDEHEAAIFIQRNWGTWNKYVIWRIKMLTRTLPKWLWRQIYAFK